MDSKDIDMANTSTALPTSQRWNDIDSTNVGYAERMASAVGGPLLALYGLMRRSPVGVALALLGGELFYRGMTGHCPIYQALGLSTAEDRAGPLHTQKSAVISSAPPQPKKPVQPRKPLVQEASEESFPASDSPSWTGTTVGDREREVGG